MYLEWEYKDSICYKEVYYEVIACPLDSELKTTGLNKEDDCLSFKVYQMEVRLLLKPKKTYNLTLKAASVKYPDIISEEINITISTLGQYYVNDIML